MHQMERLHDQMRRFLYNTSTSTVGLPRESNTSRAYTSVMIGIINSPLFQLMFVLSFRQVVDTVNNCSIVGARSAKMPSLRNATPGFVTMTGTGFVV